MIQRVNIPISVELFFDHHLRKALPKSLIWEGRKYPIIKIGLHHIYRIGHTLIHVFSVETPTLFFRLALNTDNLHWRVEEISDGETN